MRDEMELRKPLGYAMPTPIYPSKANFRSTESQYSSRASNTSSAVNPLLYCC